MELAELIRLKITTEGPISFREFMEMCLYYPGLGYYTSNRNQIGTDGDFYTSPCLTPAFGAMVGRQLEAMYYALGENPFTVIEYGAGTGALCYDILTYLEHRNQNMFDRMQYCIIEKSPTMLAVEKRHLSKKVFWHDSIEEFSDVNGCVLSNELLDNFAVHSVVMEEVLMEVFVDYQDGFIEILKPATEELRSYLAELDIELPKGFRTEANLQALDWIRNISNVLDKGFVLTIDYGYQSQELYKSSRSGGTLRCYHKHTVNDHLYEHIGSQDLTAHVNFSALRKFGSKTGLQEFGFMDQCQFLLAMGFKDYLLEAFAQEDDVAAAARKMARLSHILLLDMGTKFKVLIQSKGVDMKILAAYNFPGIEEELAESREVGTVHHLVSVR